MGDLADCMARVEEATAAYVFDWTTAASILEEWAERLKDGLEGKDDGEDPRLTEKDNKSLLDLFRALQDDGDVELEEVIDIMNRAPHLCVLERTLFFDIGQNVLQRVEYDYRSLTKLHVYEFFVA